VIFCSIASASTPPLLAFTLMFLCVRLNSLTSLSSVALLESDWPCHIVIVVTPLDEESSSPQADRNGAAPASPPSVSPVRKNARRVVWLPSIGISCAL
jgi:hypothetical protein